MKKVMRYSLAFICVGALSLFAARYSVYSITDHACYDWTRTESERLTSITEYLDEASAIGMNTIALNVYPHEIDRTVNNYSKWPGYLSKIDTSRRSFYNKAYNLVLNHTRSGKPSNFRLIIQINCQAQFMAYADPLTPLVWKDNSYFLRHPPITQTLPVPEHSGMNGINETWVSTLDFWAATRQRILNFNNTTVMNVTKSLFTNIISDVVLEAQKLGGDATDRIMNFSVNTTPSGESEYWYLFFVGNTSTNTYNTNFDLPNADRNRINWIDSWQNQMVTFHSTLSNLVKTAAAGTTYKFKYGTHLSAAYDQCAITRGTGNLSKIAAGLNPGDILGNADAPEIVFPNYNHSFSTDYYSSIAKWKNLLSANEVSPLSIFMNPPFNKTKAELIQAALNQIKKSYAHGADIFFINWEINDLKDSDYRKVALAVANTFKIGDNTTVPRVNPILVDWWAHYSIEVPRNTGGGTLVNDNAFGTGYTTHYTQLNYGQVQNLFNRLSIQYNRLSDNGTKPIQIITSHMIGETPSILNPLRTLYIPEMDTVLTTKTKTELVKKVNLSKLRLESLYAGCKNEYQEGKAPFSNYKADDLLWVDCYNKFPGDVSPDVAGLQVAVSATTGFSGATMWKSWAGLNGATFTGDFDGNGVDDFLFINKGWTLQVAKSNGSNGFGTTGTWRTWSGINPTDVRIGDFNGDGKDDVLWVDKSTTTRPGLWVALSTGTAFNTPTLWRSWTGLTTSFGFYVGDFNGDGKDDFLNFANNYQLQVARSNGSVDFGPWQDWGNWGADAADLRVGDFDGDAMDDLLWIDKANKFTGDVSPDQPGLIVSRSSGAGFTVAQLWQSRGDLTSSRGFYTGDFNGDGYDDFMNFSNNYDLQVATSATISASFSASQFWGSWGADAADIRVGNFNKPQSGLPKELAPETLESEVLQKLAPTVIIRNGVFKVNLTRAEIQKKPTLSILDISGKLVFKVTLSGGNEYTPHRKIPSGSYIVRLECGHDVLFTGKTIIQ